MNTRQRIVAIFLITGVLCGVAFAGHATDRADAANADADSAKH